MLRAEREIRRPVAVATLYSFAVSGGMIDGSQLADWAAHSGPAYFAVLWVRNDARRTGYWPAFHYGLFLWMFGLLLIPHYFVRTRGRGGLAIGLGFLLLLHAPPAASVAGWWLYEMLPDLR